MENRCPKYEQLFIFGTEQELKEHIANCPECIDYHTKMEKVAELVKEVKPLIKKTSPVKLIGLRAVAGFVTVILAFFAINPTLHEKNNYGLIANADSSPVAQMGLPTDDYGFLMIE